MAHFLRILRLRMTLAGPPFPGRSQDMHNGVFILTGLNVAYSGMRYNQIQCLWFFGFSFCINLWPYFMIHDILIYPIDEMSGNVTVISE
jgi:hypothetical protein